jgi:hypothetical protein
MILAGVICLYEPLRVVTAYQQFSKSVGPGIYNSIDIPLDISQGQSAYVTITFEEKAETDQREVWPMIFYTFPTKGVLEAVARFINQSEVRFIIGFENASYSHVFISGFIIRVFYHGSTAVLANFTIVRLENPTKAVGIGLLLVSAIPLWSIVILSRKMSSTRLTSIQFSD